MRSEPIAQFAFYAKPVVIAAVVLTVSSLHSAERDGLIRVTLRPTAKVATSPVTIGQIADVQGGHEELRERVVSLDISDSPRQNRAETVSQSQVTMRLLLADVAKHAFTVAGASQTTVFRENAPSRDKIFLDAIRISLAQHFRVPPSDLQVQLTQPLPDDARFVNANGQTLELKPIIPENLSAGRARISVAVHVDDSLSMVLPVSFDVRVYQSVVRAARTIRRGEVVSENNAVSERFPLSGQALRQIAESAMGQTARRDVQRGDIIKSSDLESPAEEDDPVLIQARDVVRIVARKGGLIVTVPGGEALQSGRKGEFIRVRNPQSRKVLRGRVVSSSEVEIPF